jgi:protein SCO1/2
MIRPTLMLFGFAIGFAAVLAVGAAQRQALSPAPPVDLTAWTRLDADEPAPGFSLFNQDGRRVALKDFAGKVVVLTFFFASCSDICPMQLNILDALIETLQHDERERLALVGVTIDPARDTPERLKAFLGERDLDPKRWQLLTGSLEETAKAAADYGILVRPSPYGDLVHNSVYILIDGKGIERFEFHGIATPREEIAKAISALLAAPAQDRGS